MADPRVIALLRRREILEAAIARLLPRLRVFSVVGGLLVLFGSAAMTGLLLLHPASLAPLGVMMTLAGLFEMGIGHSAAGGGAGTPWLRAGLAHMAAGLVVVFGGALPASILVTAIGVCITLAGVTWLRMGFAMPERFQSGVIPLSAGATAIVGILLLMRWGAGDPLLMGLMLSGEMLVRGWAWIVFGSVLGKRAAA